MKKFKANMSKKDMQDAIAAQVQMVKDLVAEDKMEEATEAKSELDDMQKKYDLLKDFEDEKKDDIADGQADVKDIEKTDSTAAFAKAARMGFKNSMNEGTKADGGYTVPEDIQTRINEYREAKKSLIDLVDVESVTTNKGSRTFKKRSQQTGFSKVGEGAAIGASSTPQFERLDYEIDKYAGYFPVTNELLDDSDQNITGTLISWIGDESRVTRNKIIIGVVNEKTKTTISSLDDIKKAYNVTLGSAFKSTSKLVTNDDGLQWLDTLKDSQNRYMLQPNPTDPAELRICAGATIIPIEVIPNGDLPSDVDTPSTRKIPMILGDLKEGIKFFDRKKTTIKTSDVAKIGNLNAFEDDLTLFRAIEREDCKVKDSEAFVNGQLSITDNSVVGKDVTLSALSIGSLTLTPTFASSTTTYTASTSNATNTITATATDTNATVEIKNGDTVVASGSAATWETGDNVVKIKVTNGTNSKEYTVTVTKS